jgi:hypothetical protein
MDCDSASVCRLSMFQGRLVGAPLNGDLQGSASMHDASDKLFAHAVALCLPRLARADVQRPLCVSPRCMLIH